MVDLGLLWHMEPEIWTHHLLLYILLASHSHTERKPTAPLGCWGLFPTPLFCLAFSAPDAYVSITLPRPQACLLLVRKGTSAFAPCDEDSPLSLCGVPSLTSFVILFNATCLAMPSLGSTVHLHPLHSLACLLCFAVPYGVLTWWFYHCLSSLEAMLLPQQPQNNNPL